MKSNTKTGNGMSNCYWNNYLSNVGSQWLLPKPWTPSIRQCKRYCTSAFPWPLEWPANIMYFSSCCFPCDPGGHRGNMEWVVIQWQHPKSSGLSPGHIASSHAVRITPTCLHGHQHALQWRYNHLLLLPFLFDVSVAKDHAMVNLN